MKLTRESLEKSLELSKKATQGPWTPFDSGPWGGKGAGIAIGEDADMWPKFDKDTSKGVANSFFVAYHNPEFIEALVQAHIEALDELQECKDALQCQLESIKMFYDERCFPTLSEIQMAENSLNAVSEFLSKHGGVK